MSGVLLAAVLAAGHVVLSIGVARWARGDQPSAAEWRRYRRRVCARR